MSSPRLGARGTWGDAATERARVGMAELHRYSETTGEALGTLTHKAEALRDDLDFLLERGGKVLLKAIDAPKTEWKSALEVAEEVAAHEAKVGGAATLGCAAFMAVPGYSQIKFLHLAYTVNN